MYKYKMTYKFTPHPSDDLKERGKLSKARTYTLKKFNISRVEWQRRPVESQLSADKAKAAFEWLKGTHETYQIWLSRLSWMGRFLWLWLAWYEMEGTVKYWKVVRTRIYVSFQYLW